MVVWMVEHVVAAALRRIGEAPVEAGGGDDAAHHLPVASRCVDRSEGPRTDAEEEEGGGLLRRAGGGHAVVDRARDEPEEEPGLVRAEVDVDPLAVGVVRRGLAVMPTSPRVRARATW